MHKRGTLPEFHTGVLSQHCVARVKKADGGKRSEDEQDRAKKKGTTLPQTDISHKAHGIKGTLRTREGHREQKVHLTKNTAGIHKQISPKPAHEIQRLKASSLSKAKAHGEHERDTAQLTKKDALFLHDLRPVMEKKFPLQKHTLQKLETCVTR